MFIFSTGTVLAGGMINNEGKSESIIISPQVYWSGNVYLSNTKYSNVSSSNNIFNDRPLVTNHSINGGAIKLQIIDRYGKRIGREKEIKKGKSVRMDTIPWNSGTYTLQAKSLEQSGYYNITID